jgi:hypothetical protein
MRENVAMEGILGERKDDVRDAVEALMDRYELPLYNFLLSRGGDRDVARDCLQHTFLLSLEHLRKGRSCKNTDGHPKAASPIQRATRCSVSVAALALGGVVTNTPLPHVIAQTLGWESPDTFNAAGLRCFKEGYGISRHYTILQSPHQFDTGPNGSFNQGAMQMVSDDLDHPIWFVYDGGGLLEGSCRAGPVTTESIEVAINPDANTQLIAVGIKKGTE